MSGRQDFTVRDAQAIHQDGLDVFTADQSMGTHKLTAVTNPAAAQDAATLASVQAATAALLSTNTRNHWELLHPAMALWRPRTTTFTPMVTSRAARFTRSLAAVTPVS